MKIICLSSSKIEFLIPNILYSTIENYSESNNTLLVSLLDAHNNLKKFAEILKTNKVFIFIDSHILYGDVCEEFTKLNKVYNHYTIEKITKIFQKRDEIQQQSILH